MTAQTWVTIAVGVLSILWAILLFVVQRRLRRTDDLERQVLFPDGALAKLRADHADLCARVGQCVSQDELDMSQAAIADQLDKLRTEANAREQRIVDAVVRSQGTSAAAVDKLRDSVATSAGEFRREIGRIHQRIDGVVGHGQRQR